MKRKDAFDLLELFKDKAKNENHLYDVYGGQDEPVKLWILYDGEDLESHSVASFRFEDVFYEEEYVCEIVMKSGKFYEFVDKKACEDLIQTISY